MVRHRLSDDEWDLISDLFPEPTGVGRPPNNPRDMMDGIRWILRTGAPWRNVPEEIGKWSSVWDAFDRWNRDGTLAEILSRLMSSHVDVGLLRNDVWLVDATIVRAARCAAGGGKEDDDDEPDNHGLGRSRGGFSTKIQVVADAQDIRCWLQKSRPVRNTKAKRSVSFWSRSMWLTMTVDLYRRQRNLPPTKGIAPTGSMSTCWNSASHLSFRPKQTRIGKRESSNSTEIHTAHGT